MKSRPIATHQHEVRAILAGQQSQLRRVVKDEWLLERLDDDQYLRGHLGTSIEDGTFGFEDVEWGSICGEEHLWEPKRMVWREVKCPYGVVGDRLWVREGYRQELNLGHDKDGNWPDAKGMYSYFYKADCDNPKGWGIGVWKSPMFMPRAASRIELEIAGIRVERVQDISEADAIAEGVEQGYGLRHVGFYQDIWESINSKKHPWESNPWVWVVEFKRVEVQS